MVRLPALCWRCGKEVPDGRMNHQACLDAENGRLEDNVQPTAPGARERVTTWNPAMADVPEADEQQGIIDAITPLGWTVVKIGQRDARGTQTPGVADIEVFHLQRGIFAKLEVKRPHKGILSDEQRKYRDYCRACGVPWLMAHSPEQTIRWLNKLRPSR